MRPTQDGATARNTYSIYTFEYPATSRAPFRPAAGAFRKRAKRARPGRQRQATCCFGSRPFSRWRAHRPRGNRHSVCRSRGAPARRAVGNFAATRSYRALRGGLRPGPIPFVRGAACTRLTRAVATEAAPGGAGRLPRESWRGSSISQHECPVPSARADRRLGIEDLRLPRKLCVALMSAAHSFWARRVLATGALRVMDADILRFPPWQNVSCFPERAAHDP
jgi:hypothetical protein